MTLKQFETETFMKSILLLIGFIMFLAVSAFAQDKAKKDTSRLVNHQRNISFPKSDTSELYILSYQEVNNLYALLQAGYQGVSTSDNFSKNQAKAYMTVLMHLDSIFRPQLLKHHPLPKK